MNPKNRYHLPPDIAQEAWQRASAGEVFETVVEELSAKRVAPEIHEAARQLFRQRHYGASFPAVLSMLLANSHDRRVEAAYVLADQRICSSFPAAFLMLEKHQASGSERQNAVAALLSDEEQLQAQQRTAEEKLAEIAARITKARARVRDLFGAREKMKEGLAALADEISALALHRAAVVARRDHYHSQIVRDLEDAPQAQPAWHVMTEMAAKVNASDLLLREIDRIISARQSASDQLKKELADYEAQHAEEFAPARDASAATS